VEEKCQISWGKKREKTGESDPTSQPDRAIPKMTPTSRKRNREMNINGNNFENHTMAMRTGKGLLTLHTELPRDSSNLQPCCNSTETAPEQERKELS